MIKEHLRLFKILFPAEIVTPTRHYALHFPTLIRRNGPLIRSSCFNYETAHNYYKVLARQQNFKNLPLSLAKCHQNLKSCNFLNSGLIVSRHPIFSRERKYGVIKPIEKTDAGALRNQFQNVYKVSWVVNHGTKYKKSAIASIGIEQNQRLPSFGKICEIFFIHESLYFEVTLFETVRFNDIFQSYEVKELVNEPTKIVPQDSLLDYNVFHTKIVDEDSIFVPTKYSLKGILRQHQLGKNPLLS